MALFRYIGVNRRRFGLMPADLSRLDGLKPVRTAALPFRKNRTPRRLKVLPGPTRPRAVIRLGGALPPFR